MVDNKTISEESGEVKSLKKSLNQINSDFMKIYNELSSHRETCNGWDEEIRVKKRALEAYNEVICVVEEHIQLNLTLKKECLIHEKQTMDAHNETLRTKLNALKADRSLVEKEIKQAKIAIKGCERELNGLKFRLSELYTMREDMKHSLIQAGLAKDEISLLFDQMLMSPCEKGESEKGESGTGEETRVEEGKVKEPNDHLNMDNWFLDNGSREEAIRVLSGKPDGTFLIRPSSQPGQFALSIVTRKVIQHCAILHDPTKQKYGFTDSLMIFPDLLSLVLHFRDLSLELYNPKLPTSLKTPFRLAKDSS